MKKIVVMGGGTGQSAILKGLKNIENIKLSAIVTVADDGGSTGRLREEFQIPAMGDVRNVMVALATSESLVSSIMDYRFDSSIRSDLAGHSMGNLMLTALAQINGSFIKAITSLSQLLNVRGEVVPASTDQMTLCARMHDGTIVRGESNIPIYDNHIDEVFYDTVVTANPYAMKVIAEADVIIFGIGSLYTSILPNIIIPEIKEAIKASPAKRVYYCNFMTQAGETNGYSGEDHVRAITKHLEADLDLVVDSHESIPEAILANYLKEGSTQVTFAQAEHDYKIIKQKLLTLNEGVVRHDSLKVAQHFPEILEVLDVL